MANEELVRYVVGTYDLPPEKQERIVRIATARIDELGLASFDDQYRCIDELVEKFTITPYERSFLRLDSFVKDGSRTTFHEIIGKEDPSFNLHDDESEKSSLQGIFEILKGHLSETDISILSQMASKCDEMQFDIQPDGFQTDVDVVHSRLSELLHRYEKDGRLLVPRRPIISVKFNPFSIKFGLRNFNENYLGYFQENRDIYGGMSRNELLDFDGVLYHGLRVRGHLDIAIPEKLTELTQEEIKAIVQTLSKNNGNVRKTSHETGHSYNTVKKYGKIKNVQLTTRGFNGSSLSDKKDVINEAYYTYDGSASRAAKYLPYSHATFIKYWKEAGFKTRKPSESNKSFIPEDQKIHDIITYPDGRQGNPLPQDEIDRILRVLSENEGNIKRTAIETQHTQNTVKKYAKARRARRNKKGGTFLNKSQRYSVKLAYFVFEGSATEAEKHLPYNRNTIIKYWKEEGFKIHQPGGQFKNGFTPSSLSSQKTNAGMRYDLLPQDEIDFIVRTLQKNDGYVAKTARETGYSATAIRKYGARKGVEIRDMRGRYPRAA